MSFTLDKMVNLNEMKLKLSISRIRFIVGYC